MSENIIPAAIALPVLADSAFVQRLVRHLQTTSRRNADWVSFVASHDVTLDNVSDYAKALANAAFPDREDDAITYVRADGKRSRTDYGTAINTATTGLKNALGREDDDKSPGTDALLTRKGGKATLDEVIAAWKAINEASDSE